MKNLLLLITLLTTSLTNAQNKELSEQEFLKLEAEAKVNMNRDRDKSFAIAKEIARSNNPIHKAASAGIECYLYQINFDETKSDEKYALAMSFLSQVPDSREKQRTQMVLMNYAGLIQKSRGNLTEAYEKFEMCKKEAIQLGENIQVLKTLNNLSELDTQAKNYKTALARLKVSDSLLHQMDDLSQEEYWGRMSQLHYRIGSCFEKYGTQKSNFALLDSAIYHYQIAVNYSADGSLERLSSQINTAILRMYKEEYEPAEKSFFHLMKVCEEADKYDYYGNILYNLGLLYIRQENYTEAELFMKKLQRHHDKHELNYIEYINSNYYLAVIYEQYKNYSKAEEFLRQFESDYSVMQGESQEEIEKLNYAVLASDLAVDIDSLNDRIKSQRNWIYVYIGSGVLLVLILVILLRKNIRDKRKVKLKLAEFKEKFVKEKSLKKKVFANTIQNFSMNDEKEKEILTALEKLVDNEYYLKADFGLQSVAKKIKTNTTYLSHVVNKNYGKSFSEYSNELKMNYVIRQMIENKTFRMYSTQAIAESVGYKSAVSFTRSFKKRTGVTPVQFLKSIDS
ncbi:MAG: helix-turn-helix domain-containing protein [Crocinitomicaceae bacterium]